MAKIEDVFAKISEFDKLKRQAVQVLLKERRILDRKLARLGHSAEVRLRKTAKRICRTCGKTGHNSRTCPMKGKKT